MDAGLGVEVARSTVGGHYLKQAPATAWFDVITAGGGSVGPHRFGAALSVLAGVAIGVKAGRLAEFREVR